MAYTSYSNITLTGGTGAGSIYTTGAGAGGYSSASVTIPSGGYTLNTGAVTGTMWSSSNYNYTPSVNIDSNGISLSDDADVKLGNVSLKDTLQTIQDRLAILVPDPKKLEKYEALKQAYEHYKLLEALCNEEEEK